VAKKTTKKTQTKANRLEFQRPGGDWVSPYIVSLRNGDKLVREFVVRACDYEVAKEVVIQKILAGKLPEFTEAVIFGVAAELTRFRVDGGKAGA